MYTPMHSASTARPRWPYSPWGRGPERATRGLRLRPRRRLDVRATLLSGEGGGGSWTRCEAGTARAAYTRLRRGRPAETPEPEGPRRTRRLQGLIASLARVIPR